MKSSEPTNSGSIFVNGSEASDQALEDLRDLLVHFGLRVRKKNVKHSTLQVYPHGFNSYPLLNPRFNESAAHIDQEWDKPCVVFDVLSKGPGGALDSWLNQFTSTEDCAFIARTVPKPDHLYHGFFLISIHLKDDEAHQRIDLDALYEPLRRLCEFLRRTGQRSAAP